jgi:anti-sigma regulatory factor (Ser/Thr protein kinase)
LNDEIQLTLPAEEDFRQIAHLVVGGLGARLDLTFEDLEDLQVALEAVLACRDDDGGEVSVVLHVVDRGVRATVGPFRPEAMEQVAREGEELGLRRVLQTVCDTFEVEQREGGAWVDLTKLAGERA